jgi:tRNA-specific 2-thiouridylase
MSERVVVAMSGGVDSSVAAALLVEAGYDVIGVMMRLWSEPALHDGPDSADGPVNRCCSLESINDARAVADRLGVPFYVVNVEQLFKARVVDFFVSGYAAGVTPNPCLACNRHIRFGYLLNYARSLGAAYLATGHYARVRRTTDGVFELWRGADVQKDQSYVLSVLGQADLAQALFPAGDYTKPQVRELAAARRLPTASRHDSQDLCFVADGDYRRFLADWAADAVRPGPILDRQDRELGRHLGLPYYTIGQRSGLGIAAAHPLYVLALDRVRNAVIVGSAAELGRDHLGVRSVNWVSGQAPAEPLHCTVQIRYRAHPVPATVIPLPDGGAEVRLDGSLRDITPGQAAVFYDGDHCLGGGLIVHPDAESAPLPEMPDDRAD